MRVAIIKENIVVNVIEAPTLNHLTEVGYSYIESNTASIGDLYVNGNFILDPSIDRSTAEPVEIDAQITVSNVQAYAALSHFNLLGPIRTLLANLPEDHLYRLAFEKAHIFKSDSVVLQEMASLLNLDNAQLKNIFAYAAAVQV